AAPYIARHRVDVARVARLEIRVDRYVHRGADRREITEHRLDRDGAIGQPLRPGKPRARRGERLEAETLQITGAAGVERIGNDEAALLVKLAKRAAFFGNGRHGWLLQYLRD